MQLRSPWLQYLSLNAVYLGTSFMWNMLHPIVLPLLLLNYGSEQTKNTRLGILTFAGYILGMVVQPLAGALSDRTRHVLGRRRPWVLYGSLAAIASLLLLNVASSFWMLAAAYLLLQITSNAVIGPCHGLIPDALPEGRRGLAIGLRNLLDMAGIIGAACCAGFLARTAGADAPVGLLLAAGLLAGTMLLTTFGSRLARAPARPAEAAAAVRSVGEVRELLQVDLRQHVGYWRLLASRFWLLLATSLLLSFGLYYIQDALRLEDPAGAVSNLMLAIGIPMALVVVPAGILSERWGRRGLSLVGCGLLAVCVVLLSVARSVATIRALALLAGVGMGTFVSVNWAWATDLAPLDQAGKYLGLANLTTAGTSALGRLMGPVIDLVNAWHENVGYQLVFVVAAAAVMTALYQTLRIPETRGPVGTEGVLVRASPGRAFWTRGKR